MATSTKATKSVSNDSFTVGRGKAQIPAEQLINTSTIPTPNQKQIVVDGKTVSCGYFSYSAISCYEKCHRLYKYEYVDNLHKERGATKMWLGSAIHACVEMAELAKMNKIPVTADAVKAVFSTALDNSVKSYENVIAQAKVKGEALGDIDWGERIGSQQDMDKLGRDLVDVYMTDYFPKTKIKAVEKLFLYPFPLKNSPGSVYFVGFIDQIEEYEGEIMVTDHKVGRKRTQADVENSDQLILYSFASNIPAVSLNSFVLGTLGGRTPSRARKGEILKLISRMSMKQYARTHEDFEDLLLGIKAGNFARTGKANNMICGENCPHYATCLKGK